MMWELRVLGPVELWGPQGRLDLGPAKQRAVLVALAVDVGRRVPVDVIIDRVWDEAPPRTVRNALHAYVLRLRRALQAVADADAAPRLEFRDGGYALHAAAGNVDLPRFTDLVQRSRGPDTDRRTAAALLREALALWRGEPLAGLSGGWAAGLRDDLELQRLSAVLSLAPMELDTGAPAGTIVDMLRPLLDRHPLVEPLAAVLIRALHADGRQPEALAVFDRARRRLLADLGTEPGAELRQAYQLALRGGTPPATPGLPAGSTVPGVPVPAQLPADVRGFTGRRAALAHLDDVLARAQAEPTAVTIATVSGTAGVGKTAVAVHWARRVRDRFPDGQLHADLRGFDPGGPPAQPGEALRGFLAALGVSPQRIPGDLAGQAALYRSMMTGRRMLVLLDNVADAGQVRPLLPGEPGCFVLVTSRNTLPGLVVTEGAEPVLLATLSQSEAQDLLIRRIGENRVAAEPAAVGAVLDACARLPLALAVAAAHAAVNPGLALSTIARELGDARSRLDPFAGTDPATDVRAVFSWSYRSLRPATARLFRLLGLHPGPDVAPHAVASLTALPVDEARRLLAELQDANLVAGQPADRFSSHDLLRAYSRELVELVESTADRRAARLRLLDHYLHTALAGNRLLMSHRNQFRYHLDDPAPGALIKPLADLPAATAWFADEERALRACVNLAATTGFDTHAWLLPYTMATHYERVWNSEEWIATQQASLAAAERSGDLARTAASHYGIGYAYSQLDDRDAAIAHLTTAAEQFTTAGREDENAHVHLSLGTTSRALGRYQEALEHAQRAHDLYEKRGEVAGQAAALNNMGWCHVTMGSYAEALTFCRQAVDIQESLQNWSGAAHSWDSVGYAHHHLGQYDEAMACYRRSRELFHGLGELRYEAIVLSHLGDAHDGAGDHGAAADAWSQAVDIYLRIGHPDAEPLREKIRDARARLTSTPSSP